MSHSTVLIIGEDAEKMLAPYDENTEVEPYRKYDDAETPQDHWLFKTGCEEGGLAGDVGWPEYVGFINKRYGHDDSDEYQYDPERDRMYELSTYNPLSRWDWYQLGGRWTGFFKLKPGDQGRVGEPGLMTPKARIGQADQARKRDIDFEGMRVAAGAEGAELHARASRLLAGLPPLVAWEKVREEMFPDDINAARRHYHSQPGIEALAKAGLHFDDPVTYLCLDQTDPLAACVARCRAEACLPFAILDSEGWHERGRMGWWGVVHNETDGWQETAQAIIDSAPDDALFSIYDVHI